MTPQEKWARDTGLDPDDYSIYDGNQSAQRAQAHRWAFARLDDFVIPDHVHVVTNRNSGCVQLVGDDGYVATLDVDEDNRPVATWYGQVDESRNLEYALNGELDEGWFARPACRTTAPTPVDIDDLDDSDAELVDRDNGQAPEWCVPADRTTNGCVSVYSGVIDLLDDPLHPEVAGFVDEDWTPEAILRAIRQNGSYPAPYEMVWHGRALGAYECHSL